MNKKGTEIDDAFHKFNPNAFSKRVIPNKKWNYKSIDVFLITKTNYFDIAVQVKLFKEKFDWKLIGWFWIALAIVIPLSIRKMYEFLITLNLDKMFEIVFGTPFG